MPKHEVVLFDADRKAWFLRNFKLCGQLQRSAQECGISPTTVRKHIRDDPDFKDAYDEAYGDFKEAIESEIMRRAIMGWEEPVYQQGILAGTVRKYDSRLLELLAKRHIPQYKEKHQVDHNIGGGILAVPIAQTAEEWEKLNKTLDVTDKAEITNGPTDQSKSDPSKTADKGDKSK